jgi:hypothetical protein
MDKRTNIQFALRYIPVWRQVRILRPYSLPSRKRQLKGDPVVSDETVMYGHGNEIALQITDPSSHERGHSKTKSKAIVLGGGKKKRKKKNLVMGPKGVPDTETDRPTDRRSLHQLN